MANFKLMVEVCHACNLKPKDGEGSSSPYVEVHYGNQKQRTAAKNKDLNPVWNEKLEFVVEDPELLDEQYIDVHVLTMRGRGSALHQVMPASLGRAKISGVHFKLRGSPGVDDPPVPFSLDSGIFSQTHGEIFLKLYYYDPAKLPSPQSQKNSGREKTASEKDGSSSFEKGRRGGGGGDEYNAGSSREVKHAVSSRVGSNMGYAYGYPRETLPSENFAVMATKPRINSDRAAVGLHELVAPMEYLFLRVVRARNLSGKDVNLSLPDPFVEVKAGNRKTSTRTAYQSLNPEWNEVFAFEREQLQASHLEVTVWDKDAVLRNDFLGYVSFDVLDIPARHPPDSPLAPQWYRLEPKRSNVSHESFPSKRVKGEIMLSVWIGTQADEAFPDAWQSDTGGHSHARSKVYLSPKLWYLRVHIIEAQDVAPVRENRTPEICVKADLGFQSQKTRLAARRSNYHPNNPVWNEDMVFVAAEPFDDVLRLTLLDRVTSNKEETLASVRIPLDSAPRRIHHKEVDAQWFLLEKERDRIEDRLVEKVKDTVDKMKDMRIDGRIHIRICLEGGYHVLDESVHHSSDTRPTDKRLWKSRPLGFLELGILGASNLLPMKIRDNRSSTDAYCVAKYGPKWVRTRTVLDSFDPRWNEQYTWDVHDPSTVLSVGVFDNLHLASGIVADGNVKTQGSNRDQVLGKVRIRLSTLDTGRVYTHSYPLISLDRSGVKKMGELELAVRFTCLSRLNLMCAYFQPLLPKMHYLRPFNPRQQEMLRIAAMKIVIARLARSEPPLRQEVVQYMLDVDSNMWSMRKSKANWLRISRVFSGLVGFSNWCNDICLWKNPITTVLVHMLYLVLICYPELILPTVFLYMFLIGIWQFRFRPRKLPHMDIELSCAKAVEPDDLDEEFDGIPTSKGNEIVRARYDRVRLVAGRIQAVVSDIATQLERFHALLDWRDPRATTIFILFCFLAAIILYVTPFQVLAVVLGIYVLRHPKFRTGMPSILMNFFRRLPALADRML